MHRASLRLLSALGEGLRTCQGACQQESWDDEIPHGVSSDVVNQEDE
jgi:hypothetical protein